MKKWIAIFALLFTSQVFAGQGYIVKGATVTKVSSTSNNVDAFWVYYTGGSSDKCSGRVKYIATKAGTSGVFERSFSLATTALVTGKKVEIYSYTDNTDCFSAASINLTR